MKDMNFARIKGGNYDKFQEALDNDKLPFPCYVYDELARKLIWINEDKTWNYIDEQPYKSLVGTQENPVDIGSLNDGMYIIQGNYSIKNTDIDYVAKYPIMISVEKGTEDSVHVSVYSGNGCMTYNITGETTTMDKLATETVVISTVNTAIEEQVPGIIEDSVPSVISDNIRPATDNEIEDLIDSLFDHTNGGGD